MLGTYVTALSTVATVIARAHKSPLVHLDYTNAPRNPHLLSRSQLNLDSPDFFKSVGEHVAALSDADWKDYLTWNVVNALSEYVSIFKTFPALSERSQSCASEGGGRSFMLKLRHHSVFLVCLLEA